MVAATIEQIQQRSYTAAEFEAMPLGDGRFELIVGEFIEMAAAGGQHGALGVRFVIRLGAFVEDHDLGTVYGPDTGFVIQENPDTVFVPDVAFVLASRLIPEAEQTGFIRAIPDLVLEIVSPNDTRREIANKVAIYLAVGVRIVVVADPKTTTFVVHRPGEPSRILGEDDVFVAGDLIPGFSVRVGDVMRPRPARGARPDAESDTKPETVVEPGQ